MRLPITLLIISLILLAFSQASKYAVDRTTNFQTNPYWIELMGDTSAGRILIDFYSFWLGILCFCAAPLVYLLGKRKRA